jgi:hypothetical protein
MKNNITEIAKNYLKIWSNNDLNGLETLFMEDCSLRDWDEIYEGKDTVMEANKNIFNSFESIIANPLNIYTDEKNSTVIAELEIISNGTDKLLVTDIIVFENDKIKSIRAYKGN